MDEDPLLAANNGEIETPVADSPLGESAPPEETTPETGVDASEKTEITPPSEEEKQVPLSALQRERDLRKQAEEQSQLLSEITKKAKNAPTGNATGDVPFDDETAKNLDQWYAKKRREEFDREQSMRSSAFADKHAEELADPLLDAMTRKVIHDANQIDKIIDQEDALVIAKAALEARLQTAEAKAKVSGFDEGQQTALTKTRAGAVGDTAVKAPPVDPATMNAAEYATYFGIPRAD